MPDNENTIKGFNTDAGVLPVDYNSLANKPTIPSKTSDIENDSGFITEDDIPTIPSKTSELTNDSGFITAEDIPAPYDDTLIKSDITKNTNDISTLKENLIAKANDSEVVKITPQTLTDAQKAQARQNIGVGDSGTVDEVARAEIANVKTDLTELDGKIDAISKTYLKLQSDIVDVSIVKNDGIIDSTLAPFGPSLSRYKHSIVDVIEGDSYIVTCFSTNNSYCGAFFRNSENENVSKALVGNNVGYTEELIKVPNGYNQLCLNSTYDNTTYPITVKHIEVQESEEFWSEYNEIKIQVNTIDIDKVNSVVSDVEELQDIVEGQTYEDYVEVTDGLYQNGYYTTNNKYADSSAYRSLTIDVNEGETLLVSAQTPSNTGYSLCVFADENDTKIASAFDNPTSSAVVYYDQEVTVPVGAKIVHVTTNNLSASVIRIPIIKRKKKFYGNDSLIKYTELLLARNILKDKVIVNFGDSIFGLFDSDSGSDKSISVMIAEQTGATVLNCGFGGCRMVRHPTSTYDAFSMTKLSDAVATGDWSLQDVAGASLGGHYERHLEILKSLDWNNVDIITIGYGTNDFTGAISMNQFKNAIGYVFETILTAYPHLKVLLISPCWRWYMNDEHEYTTDSDIYVHETSNLKLTDYVDACEEEAKKYHIPYCDTYYNLGFNKFNRLVYFNATDGTHPNVTGRQLRANKIISALFDSM